MAWNSKKEGDLTKKIEKQTVKIPSGVFLLAAGAVMTTAVILKCVGRRSTALLVGQFTSPLLIMGLYNKLVRTEGHD